jgi:uncharacterized membrane-anchored protein
MGLGLRLLIGAFFYCNLNTVAWAQTAADSSEQASQKVFADAMAASTAGPKIIALGAQGNINLGAGYIFIPEPHANRVRNAMGNPGQDSNLIGLIFPDSKQNEWFAVVRFEKSGYVKDDDAKSWDADGLLTSFKEGTEQSNAERVKLGVPAMEIVGWAEKPAYDSKTQRLVWAMSSKDKGASASEPQGVNYNTYMLGREGYFSLNLVTGLNELPRYKTNANELLAAVSFVDGKKYSDFDSKTDKVAEYGLAALVVGVAAKKLGLFAGLLVLLAKFWKIGLIASLAFGGSALKLFKRKPKVTAGNDQGPTNPS